MTVIFPKSTVAFARSGFVLLFLFIVVQTGFSQWGTDTLLNSHMRQGINYVYNLDFDNATKDFGELIRLKPENPAGYFFMAMIDWEKILLDLDNTSHD